MKIYQKAVKGRIRNLKWIILFVTLGIYYFIPFLRWNRGENISDQAFLIDISIQKIYFFDIEIWPQEFYLFMLLMIISAMGLFIVTSLFGRIWCGFTCPQTVWTDLYFWVERKIEGRRNQRIINDGKKLNFVRFLKKCLKHFIWLLIALITGGAITLYFHDAPSFVVELFSGNASFLSYTFLGIITFTTYMLAGFAREKVCTHMCPWPRFQAAMFDKDSLIVTYQKWRGEKRGSLKKGKKQKNYGDCINCNQCVEVCPTGIDIRDGDQLECIGCGLCVDACNDIMEKVGLEKNLIKFDTLRNQESLEKFGRKEVSKILRPKAVIYFSIMCIATSAFFYLLLNRSDFEASINQIRKPLFVKLSDGSIRNGYDVKITNKRSDNSNFIISIKGEKGYVIFTGGDEYLEGKRELHLDIGKREIKEYKIFVKKEDVGVEKTKRFSFVIENEGSQEEKEIKSVFVTR